MAAVRTPEGGLDCFLPSLYDQSDMWETERPLYGFVGWACRFRRDGSTYLLHTVHELETALTPVNGKKELTLERNPRAMTPTEQEGAPMSLPGKRSVVVTAVTRFADYLEFQGHKFPLYYGRRSASEHFESRIVLNTLKVLDERTAELALRMVPPPEYGLQGELLDHRDSRRYVYGATPMKETPEEKIQLSASRLRELGNSSWVMIATLVSAAVTVGCLVWMKRKAASGN
jgi:hypothetical protein